MALSPDGRRLRARDSQPCRDGALELRPVAWQPDTAERRRHEGDKPGLDAGWTTDSLRGVRARPPVERVFGSVNETREPARVLPESELVPVALYHLAGRALADLRVRRRRSRHRLVAGAAEEAGGGAAVDEDAVPRGLREVLAGRASILYMSDESGRAEVYVRTFPIGPERVQVSTNGASMPIWAPDGREIFYRTPTALMGVTVTRTPAGLAASAPQQLFTIAPDCRIVRPVRRDVRWPVPVRSQHPARSCRRDAELVAEKRAARDDLLPERGWTRRARCREHVVNHGARVFRSCSTVFGSVCVNRAVRSVTGAAGSVHLTTKALDLLLLLLDSRLSVVSKQIYERLWPGTFVTESSIQTLIHEIREAIDVPGEPNSWIRTVRGVGYCFEGDVVASGWPPDRADRSAGSMARRRLESRHAPRGREHSRARRRRNRRN